MSGKTRSTTQLRHQLATSTQQSSSTTNTPIDGITAPSTAVLDTKQGKLFKRKINKERGHPSTPCQLDSPSSLPATPMHADLHLESLDVKFQRQTEAIIASFKEEMEKTRNEVLLRIIDIEQQLSEHVNKINSALSNLSQRADKIESDVNNVLKGEIADLQKRCDTLE